MFCFAFIKGKIMKENPELSSLFEQELNLPALI